MMLTTADPAAQSRLRKLVHKYRDLALRAEKEIDSPPLQMAEDVVLPRQRPMATNQSFSSAQKRDTPHPAILSARYA